MSKRGGLKEGRRSGFRHASIAMRAGDSETVTLPRPEYEALIARLEEFEDAALLHRADAEARAGKRVYLPWPLAKRMNAGEHPVRIWREHRGLTLTALAAKAKMPAGYLSEIENGKKPGSIRAFKALARALGATLDDLTP